MSNDWPSDEPLYGGWDCVVVTCEHSDEAFAKPEPILKSDSIYLEK